MSGTRVLVLVALVVATFATSAGAATTEPGVSNDTIATALDISELPYAHSTFTDEAVDNSDDSSNDSCYGEDSGYSVWYRYTPSADQLVRFATAGSDFDTVLDVFAGEQRELIACNDDGGWDLDSSVAINAVAGETYLIRAAGLGGDRGLLEFSAKEAIPMEASLDVADQGVLRPVKKRVVLDGVLECNQDGFAFVQFVASQGVGPAAANGNQGRFLSCTEGEERPFTVRVRARKGAFVPGPVDVEWFGSACAGGGGVIIVEETGGEAEAEPGSGGTVSGSGSATVEEEEEAGEDPTCVPLEGTQSVTVLPALPQ